MQGNLIDSVGGSPNIPKPQANSLPLLSFISHANTHMQKQSSFVCSNGVCPHQNCLISAIRGARQGLYYGGKVRFAHSLVMQVLFGSGTLASKLKTSIQLSWQHGRNLGVFVFIYKLIQCLLSRLYGKVIPLFSFIAGIIGAYFVWSEKNSVNQQLCFYLLSRVLQGIAQSAQQANYIPNKPAFAYISVICWGLVMYLFEANKSSLQPSLESSMQFLYKDSDKTTGWRDFVPFYIPDKTKSIQKAGAKSPTLAGP